MSRWRSVLGVMAAAMVAWGARGEELSPEWQAHLQWWREARFGMFIHWGPVSLTGHEIGWSRGAQTPIEVYDNLYKQFNPTNFDADAWVKIAKDAGMKYIVLTTKHHDGFCLWDTKQTDFNIMNSPFGRDVMKELSAACKRQGIALGTYYSTCDWHHPAFPRGSPGGKSKKPNPDLEVYTKYLMNQVEELITKYGPLSVLWYDVPQDFDKARGERVIAHTRKLQPSILINNRTGAPGDYDTPEQHVGGFKMDRPWETCMTICRQWAWKPDDTMKTLAECLRTLVLCVGGDGNLLFNVGPMPDGRIEPRQVDRLKEMGAWIQQYGESIYATRGGPYKPTAKFASTRRGNVVYLHLLGGLEEPVRLPPLPRKVVGHRLLTGGDAEVAQDADGLTITVPPASRREIDTIVRLELDGPAMDLEPIRVAPAVNARASNVFQKQDEYAAEMAFDNDDSTRWATDASTKQAWIEVEFAKPRQAGEVRIKEAIAKRVTKFVFERAEGEGWAPVFEGTELGEKFRRRFPAVEAKKFRLNILEATDGPTISEIQIAE